MEAILLPMVVLSPWALGASPPPFEFLLYVGIGLLLLVWAARMLWEGRLTWKMCPVALCLAALLLSVLWQLAPLSPALLGRLSPATTAIYERFLPSRPEVLPPGVEEVHAVLGAGSTISLYPAGTRLEAMRLLAVLLLFLIVRNNIDPVGGLRRLSVVVLCNGALLSLFALVQLLSAPPSTVYWRYPTHAQVFGPFNRNHFAFYINLCLALGVGLLLAAVRRSQAHGHERPRPDSPHEPEPEYAGPGWLHSLLEVLHHPRVLWISLTLGLMASSVLLSLSRGGLLALLGAFVVCVALQQAASPARPKVGLGLLIVAVAVGLVGWFGMDRVEARLSTLWKGGLLQDGRATMWADLLPTLRAFPLFGTGLGTFRYVEPLHRSLSVDFKRYATHAHNEYLEAMLEGGVVRLSLSLIAICLVYRLGYRALRQYARRPFAGIILGGLFAFTTLVLHSAVDFGVHIPAITLLATVLCAYLSGLGVAPASAASGSDQYALRCGGLAPLAGATVAVLFAGLLCAEGRRVDRAWVLQRASVRSGQRPGLEGQLQRIASLEDAVRLVPEDASLQLDLAEAHFDAFKLRADQAAPRQPTAGHLLPALRRYLLARDLCPLMPKPQVRLAAHCDKLAQADPRSAYLQRAKALLPTDPELWFFCGEQELAAGHLDEACRSWHRTLELSDMYLEEVLDRSAAVLDPGMILTKVLPDQPVLLVRAAEHLFPRPAARKEREPFLMKAVALLDRLPGAPGAQDLHTRAAAYAALDQPGEACLAYAAALAQDPTQAAWRHEFARLLRRLGRLHEARRELAIVLQQQPGNTEARELADAISRDIAAKL